MGAKCFLQEVFLLKWRGAKCALYIVVRPHKESGQNRNLPFSVLQTIFMGWGHEIGRKNISDG